MSDNEQPNDKPSSESVAALSEEDRKRINAYAKGIANGAGDGNADFDDYAYDIATRAAEYEHRYMAAKQAELLAENEKLKVKADNWDKLEPAKKLLALSEGKQADTSWMYKQELEQLRSERDKMRELLKQTFYRFEDEQWFPSDLYDKILSALSVGSKQ